MKANELRIGNWVNSLFCYVIVKEIYQDNKIAVRYESRKQEVLPIKDFNPVPLTPETLKMCGFVYDSEDNGDSLAESYVLDKLVWSVGLKEMYYNNEPLPHIEYLHQLQNLVFALTGKELKVNFHVEAAN